MNKLDTQIIRKDGKEEYVVLPWEQFVELQDRLEDLEDLVDIRQARAADDGEHLSAEQVKSELGLD